MSDDWYRLLRSVHYLGYHSTAAMSYGFDEARKFTLVTSNEAEVKEIGALLQQGGRTEAAIWVIEGQPPQVRGERTEYYLREVFHPRRIEKAEPEHYAGARKRYEFSLTGENDGHEFERPILLNDEPWFQAFFEDNGRFAFGLRRLRDSTVKEHFLQLVRQDFEE